MNNLQKSQPQIGVIDIGSNSIRLVIYDVFGAHFTPVYNEKILAGLGRDLKITGRLSESGKRACLQGLQRFYRIARARNLPQLLISATAAMRVAKDASDFLNDIYARTGLKIDPISGAEEARLAGMGLIAGDVRRHGLAADLGGASLELMQVANGQIGKTISLPFGPFDVVGSDLRQIKPAQYSRIGEQIDDGLRPLPPELIYTDTLYLIGGAWRNLAAVHQQRTLYPMRTLQAYQMSADEAQSLAHWAYNDGIDTVLNWSGMRRARAETLPYAGLMLEKLLALTDAKRVVISIAGLREGMVFDTFSPAVQTRDAMLDGCVDFAYGAEQEKNFGEPLFEFMKRVTSGLSVMFDEASDIRLYKAACLLAGIGKNLHPDYRAELVFDDILYAPIAGLTHQERAFLALIIFRSFTYKRAVPNKLVIKSILSEEQIKTARLIGGIIRLAIVATGRSVDLLGEFVLYIDDDILTLSVAQEEVALMTEQVIFRLERLGQFMGYATNVDTHKV
ncbi:MAG: Ppx/GppA phosphatase family protein [Litorimonas sp.]